MNLEDFQLLDNERIDISVFKENFLSIYHQQPANLIDSDQNNEIIFGENKNYHQIGKAYLQNEMTIKKDFVNAADRVLIVGDVTRLVNKAFAYCF